MKANGSQSRPRKPRQRLIHGNALAVLERLPKDHFDLIVTSPPYNIGKKYEKHHKWELDKYLQFIETIVESLCQKVTSHGSICWQVGNYIKDGEVFPLDIYTYGIFKKHGMKLRNRIIWRFNFGLNSTKRLSGRYETILWFTKGDKYTFNFDQVRVPQIYPGKRHAKTKGQLAGLPSGNRNGKNPSDYWEFSSTNAFLLDPVWDLPNVKANHPEKTIHPCQFPLELVERCILALTNAGDVVLDPFVGTGTTVIAAAKHDRRGVGIDKSKAYIALARTRLAELRKGTLKMRPLGKPIHMPNLRDRVAMIPQEWAPMPKNIE